MNRVIPRIALALPIIPALLGGCGTISSWFPDKQKQYQYSTEIPPLEIPPDLTSSTIDGVPPRRVERSPEAAGEDRTVPPVGEIPQEPTTEGESARPAVKKSRSQAAPILAEGADSAPKIEIEAPFEIAWVEVAKALGRMELEISDQNRSDGVYYVYYGGDKTPGDQGFLGNLMEMFTGGAEPSVEYRIRLEDKEKTTAVYVLDAENRAQSSGTGFDLLRHLHETLQSGAGTKRAAGESEPGDTDGSSSPESEGK